MHQPTDLIKMFTRDDTKTPYLREIELLELERTRKRQGPEFYTTKLNDMLDQDTVFLYNRYEENWPGFVTHHLSRSMDVQKFLDGQETLSSEALRLIRFLQSMPIVEYLQDKVTERPERAPGGATDGLERFFTVEDPERLIDGLKKIFYDQKGKELAMMFLVLKEENLIGSGTVRTTFYKAVKQEFSWDIGTADGFLTQISHYETAIKFPIQNERRYTLYLDRKESIMRLF